MAKATDSKRRPRNELYEAFSNGLYSEGSPLVIRAPSAVKNLFSVGRFFALAEALRKKSVGLELILDSPAAVQHFDALELRGYCGKAGIKVLEQMALFGPGGGDAEESPDGARGAGAALPWKCLLPVLRLDTRELGEGSWDTRTSRVLQRVTEVMLPRMRTHGIDVDTAGIELTQAVSGVVREFVSNALQHSGSDELVLAAILQEPAPGARRARRGSRDGDARQTSVEFLVADFGRGLLPTIREVVEQVPAGELAAYCDPAAPWRDEWAALRHQESHLLANLFRSWSPLRRGRGGEGFYEAGQRLAWFGGCLCLATGRSGMRLLGGGGGSVRVHRSNRERPYLPGLCVSVSLPLRLARPARAAAHPACASAPAGCAVRRFERTPPGLFTPLSEFESRRQAEFDCHQLLQELGAGSAGLPEFRYVDLKFSTSINVAFVDQLIQELCRATRATGPAPRAPFHRFFFANVPRDVIYRLREHSCAAMLMLYRQFCLLLDEACEPHLLGMPRMVSGLAGPEECLEEVFREGTLAVGALNARGATGPTLAAVEALLPEHAGALFHRSRAGGQTHFHAHDVRAALQGSWAGHLETLDRFRVAERGSAAIRLRNGCCVDSIIDFCLAWSQDDVLLDCAMLLLARCGLPLVGTLVAFMNNGDRLAAAIQRVTRVPTLLIQDPVATEPVGPEVHGEVVVVIDALYPGDEHDGYVRRFVENVGPGARVVAVYAFQDYRGDERGETFLGLPLRTVGLVAGFEPPRRTAPSDGTHVLSNHEFYLLSKLREDGANARGEALAPPAAPRREAALAGEQERVWRSFEQNEFSPGFWHHVSQTGLLRLAKPKNETRFLVFYEDTFRLIQDVRLRRIASEYVREQVRGELRGRVDVVLHPSHPVASFVAQLVAMHLGTLPLTLPLTRTRYGGRVVLAPPDYDYYRHRLNELRARLGRDRLHCLIVDDAIISGSSAITMLGVASNLDVAARNILVLVNRLPVEYTAALEAGGVQLHALYRLHMPGGWWETAPKRTIDELEGAVQDSAKSTFARRWSRDNLANRPWELSRFRDGTPGSPLPLSVPDIPGEPLKPQVERVLRDLVFGPRPSGDGAGAHVPERHAVDFETRLAIVYNFLQPLVAEPCFWRYLDAVLAGAMAERSDSELVRLLRGTLFMITHSRHVEAFGTFQALQKRCEDAVVVPLLHGTWVALCDLVVEALVHTAVIGSERLLELGRLVLKTLVPVILPRVGAAAPPAPPPGAVDAARRIVEAFAWALDRLAARKGDVLRDQEPFTALVEEMVGAGGAGSRADLCLMLVDVLEPLLRHAPRLRAALDIRTWTSQDTFLAQLRACDGRNELMAYLSRAPGYTCTLSTVLMLCRADTILVFASSSPDDDYALRIFYTKGQHRGEDTLTAENMRMENLPRGLDERMRLSLFFHARDAAGAGFLNRYRVGSEHTWAIGGPVVSHAPRAAGAAAHHAGMSYYVVLGYETFKPHLAATAYTYWLQAERVLRTALPEIHTRYVESGTAWNIAIQSLTPLHQIRTDVSTSPKIRRRRRWLRLALHALKVGDMLRRAVRISAEPLFRASELADRVDKLCKDLRHGLADVEDELRDHAAAPAGAAPPHPDDDPWPAIGCTWVGSEEEGGIYLSLHIAVLEFIALESLINALTYRGGKVQVSVGLRWKTEAGENAGEAAAGTADGCAGDGVDGSAATAPEVVLTIRNDVHPDARLSTDSNPHGRSACDTAAAAVYGQFTSAPDAAHPGWWKTEAVLPTFLVPENLQKELDAYLPK